MRSLMILFGSSGSELRGYGLDRASSGYGQVTGTSECGNELSRSS
jgi:hypothetical protein